MKVSLIILLCVTLVYSQDISKRGGKCSTTANCDAQLACLNGTCQPGVDVGGSCTSNLECNAGLACSVEYGRPNGKCLKQIGVYCEQTSQCLPEFYCINIPDKRQACFNPVGHSCWGDAYCASLKCGSDRKCTPAQGEVCSFWSACPDSTKVCSEMNCVDPPTCKTDDDCAWGLACSNGKCLMKQSASCSADSQCAGGLTCTNGRCLAQAGGVCNANSDCISSLVCLSGKCADPVTFGGSCTSWDQCENGTYCDLDWDKPGAPGLCLRGWKGSCTQSSDCQRYFSCSASTSTCLGKSGGYCMTNEECASGTCKKSSDATSPSPFPMSSCA